MSHIIWMAPYHLWTTYLILCDLLLVLNDKYVTNSKSDESVTYKLFSMSKVWRLIFCVWKIFTLLWELCNLNFNVRFNTSLILMTNLWHQTNCFGFWQNFLVDVWARDRTAVEIDSAWKLYLFVFCLKKDLFDTLKCYSNIYEWRCDHYLHNNLARSGRNTWKVIYS